jgi:SAM-dependent methyltransferase
MPTDAAQTGEKKTSVPFVDYYTSNGISPVAQNIQMLDRHYGRRASLYRLLGIIPGLVAGRRVLELGPGSGFNSLYTQHLNPSQYVMVDGNAVGIEKAKALFQEYYPNHENVEFVHSLFQDYHTEQVFDFVFCELAIVYQLDPPAFAQDLCRFVAPGGVLVVTCTDAISDLSETVRRLLATKYADTSLPVFERLEILRPHFAEDLASLKHASRPLDDWILDNITHPFEGRLFSIADALDALGERGLEIHGSSPSFRTDWRWYKEIVPGAENWNTRFRSQYFQNVLNNVDYRYLHEPHTEEFGVQLLDVAGKFWDDVIGYEHGEKARFASACAHLGTLRDMISPLAPETGLALGEVLEALISPSKEMHALPHFRPMFGRGSQYLSFLARTCK